MLIRNYFIIERNNNQARNRTACFLNRHRQSNLLVIYDNRKFWKDTFYLFVPSESSSQGKTAAFFLCDDLLWDGWMVLQTM